MCFLMSLCRAPACKLSLTLLARVQVGFGVGFQVVVDLIGELEVFLTHITLVLHVLMRPDVLK